MKAIRWMIHILAFAALVAASSGCKSYMHFKYGMTQPKEETPGKLLSFLEKNQFPATGLCMFSDSGTYGRAIRNPAFRQFLLSHMIFDREGRLLQRDTAKCQWSGYEKIKSLSPDSTYVTVNELELDPLLRQIKPFGKSTSEDTLTYNPDFTVIVTWAKFIGTYNKRLFVLSDAVRLNKTARLRILWLNIDMQESWRLKPGQKMAIK